MAGPSPASWLTAVGLHNLGNVTRDLGDLDAAAAYFLPVLDAYADNDDRWRELPCSRPASCRSTFSRAPGFSFDLVSEWLDRRR